MPSVLKVLMEKGFFKSYFSLILITFIFHVMIWVIQRQGTSTRPVFLYLFRLKNLLTLAGVCIYWLGLDGWMLFDLSIVKFMVPQLIYWSTLIVFVIQVVGLFIPKLTHEINQNDEKEFPVKWIKEVMFFMLFNIFHVLILIGGKDTPI